MAKRSKDIFDIPTRLVRAGSVAMDPTGTQQRGIPAIDGLEKRQGILPVDKLQHQDIPVATLTDWDVHAVKRTLEQFELGMFYDAAMLSDYMLRDDRYSSAMKTRITGVTGCPIVMQGETDPKIGQAYLERRGTMLSNGTERLMRRWAVALGYAIGENVWNTDVPVSKSSPLNITKREWSVFVKPWHPFSTYYDIYKRQYVVTTMDAGPIWLPADGGDGKWFVYTPYGSYRGWMDGVIRCCAIPFLLRQYALRDWGRYSEVHGLPTRVGKIPMNAKPTDRDMFLQQILNLASSPNIILPQAMSKDQAGFEFELKEAMAGNWSAFERLIIRCEVGITLAILSQNLTSEVQGGSFAAAFIHNEVRQDVKEDDEQSWAYAEWQQLIRPWAEYNYGDPDKAPIARRDVRQPEDKTAEAAQRLSRAQAVAAAATALNQLTTNGVKVDVVKYAEQYGIPLEAGQGDAKMAPAPAGGTGVPGQKPPGGSAGTAVPKVGGGTPGIRPLVPPKTNAPSAIEGT